MHIVLTATAREFLLPFSRYLESEWEQIREDRWKKGPWMLDILITGGGRMDRVYGITKYLQYQKDVDHIIDVGWAHMLDPSLSPNTVYSVTDFMVLDSFSKAGNKPTAAPEALDSFSFLRQARSLCVRNYAQSPRESGDRFSKYRAELEELEGGEAASFVAHREKTPILNLRSTVRPPSSGKEGPQPTVEAINAMGAVLIQMFTIWQEVASETQSPAQ